MRPLIAEDRREKKSAPARRRRRVNPVRLAVWLALASPWLALTALAGGGVWAVWSDGGPGSFAARVKSEVLLASMRLGFEIDEVWVDGLQRTDRTQALAAIGAGRGEPILEFDPAAARARLLQLPWIKDAVVARALPQKVHVTLTERTPLALWQKDRRLHVIDRDGAIIRDVDVARFARLPIMVGDGADTAAADLLKLVAAEPRVAKRLTAAIYIDARRWNLRLDDRVDIRLPAERPGQALARLAALDREHGLLAKDIIAIDLRLADRLIVQLAPGAETAAAEPDRRG